MLNIDTAVLTSQQMAKVQHQQLWPGATDNAARTERMGQWIAQAIEQRWMPCTVLVLCGPGGNGADGLATAQSLMQAGWPTRVAMLAPCDERARMTSRWQGPVEAVTPSMLEGAELIVDALFGTGLSRPLEETVAFTLAQASTSQRPIVAIDLPSGLFCDTGVAAGAVPCTLTIVCGYKKPAHLLQPGRALCGEVLVAGTGRAPEKVLEHIQPDTFENHPLLWLKQLPMLQAQGHKYTRGHALIYGGWPTTGAARMAAMAAARMGAGLTTIAVPEIALPIYAAALLSIMAVPIAHPKDLPALLSDPRYTGLLIGPGAGLGTATRAHVLSMLATGSPTVLDADALACFQDDPQTLFDAIAGPCVLTPHEGEFKKLFQKVLNASDDKLTRARSAARISRATVILKGNDTVIADPNGTAIINANAPPTLATAGAGDVLAGMVLGLLTQGMPPFLASAAAVWLHGAAASSYGLGLIAEDLPNLLPAVLQKLQASHHQPTNRG